MDFNHKISEIYLTKLKIGGFNQKIKKDLKMSNPANMAKNPAGESVFGGSADVSSQLNIIHTYQSHPTKKEPWNSIMKAAAPTYRLVPKTTASAPSLIFQ